VKVSKADQPRVILLGLLLVVIFGAVALQVASFQAPTNTQVEAPGPSDDPAVAEVGAATGSFEQIVPPSGPGSDNPNPFRQVLASKDSPVTPPPVAPPVIKPPTKELGTLPGPVDPGGNLGVTIQLPALPKLTGVLLGDKALAVFESEGKSQMAQVGQRLPNGYVVREISERGVVLTFGKQRFKLSLDD
jgi:hypothetical protein